MRFHLATLGCRLNEAELALWTRALRDEGHVVLPTPSGADVIVLNTCAVTAEAARKSRQVARRLHRQSAEARLVLTGCFAELEPAIAAELAGVDLIVGNRDKDRFVDLLLEQLDVPQASDGDGEASTFPASHTRGFVKVQDGCRNQCAYCIVTIARGEERSQPVADIVAHVSELAASGVREVVLTGVHLGGYGHDLGTSLHALVAAVLRDTPVERLRLSSLEPWDLNDRFWTLWEDPRLCPHLHLPLQSGCDSVLRRMARRCMTQDYRALVRSARSAIDGLTVTTDLIVGFPGETDAEWAQTLAFVEELGFAHVHVFAYSPREGTRAARLPDVVSQAAKRERSQQAHALAARLHQDELRRWVGKRRTVLWEGQGVAVQDPTRPDAELEAWTGYTDNYLRVETHVPTGLALRNQSIVADLVDVLDGERLLGRLAP